MTLLKLKGDKVVGVYNNIDPSYTPKENEALIDKLPGIELQENEIAYIYYIDKKIEYIKENRNGII